MPEIFRLYIYREDGKHDGAMDVSELALRMVFVSMIEPAVRAKREVVITDAGDFCVFHSKDGEIIWPTK